MTKVSIVEDHPIVAQGIKSIIHSLWPHYIVDIFNHLPVDEHLNYIEQSQIIIADLHLKEQYIFDDLILLQLRQPNQKIILYTSCDAWELGVNKSDFPFFGYVQKNADLTELTSCLMCINKQPQYIQEDLNWEKKAIEASFTIVLTKREQEILKHIRLGLKSKEIAEILFLSELTVKSHRQNMMRKFGAKNVVELLEKSK